MTEAEWRACEDPTRMLLFIKGRRTLRKQVKQRKQRLFAAACCRRLQPGIDDRGGFCIDVAERFADGRVASGELQTAEAQARAIWLEDAADEVALACLQLCRAEVDGLHVSTSALSAVFERQRKGAGERFDPLDGRRTGAFPPAERVQSALVRCVFGNPFRPFVVDPEWRTQNVLVLAEGIYADRTWDRLPVLADALEDAGCTDPDVLGHCRADGPHARGCWVVDLVLGKA